MTFNPRHLARPWLGRLGFISVGSRGIGVPQTFQWKQREKDFVRAFTVRRFEVYPLVQRYSRWQSEGCEIPTPGSTSPDSLYCPCGNTLYCSTIKMYTVY